MTRFSSNNLSKEDKKETLENNRCLSVALLNPYLIIPEIVKMSQNIKNQLAEFEKHTSLSTNGKGESSLNTI